MFNVTITTAVIFLNIVMLPFQIGKRVCFSWGRNYVFVYYCNGAWRVNHYV